MCLVLCVVLCWVLEKYVGIVIMVLVIFIFSVVFVFVFKVCNIRVESFFGWKLWLFRCSVLLLFMQCLKIVVVCDGWVCNCLCVVWLIRMLLFLLILMQDGVSIFFRLLGMRWLCLFFQIVMRLLVVFRLILMMIVMDGFFYGGEWY